MRASSYPGSAGVKTCPRRAALSASICSGPVVICFAVAIALIAIFASLAAIRQPLQSLLYAAIVAQRFRGLKYSICTGAGKSHPIGSAAI
jgi:hypothetical protein